MLDCQGFETVPNQTHFEHQRVAKQRLSSIQVESQIHHLNSVMQSSFSHLPTQAWLTVSTGSKANNEGMEWTKPSWRRWTSLILSECRLNMIELVRLFIVDMNHSVTCVTRKTRRLFNDLLVIKRFARRAYISCIPLRFMQRPHCESCLLQLVFDQVLRWGKQQWS